MTNFETPRALVRTIAFAATIGMFAAAPSLSASSGQPEDITVGALIPVSVALHADKWPEIGAVLGFGVPRRDMFDAPVEVAGPTWGGFISPECYSTVCPVDPWTGYPFDGMRP